MDNIFNNNFNKGLIAGMTGSFVVYPIDVIKTKMQNQNKTIVKLYKNGFDCWKQTWLNGGIKSFYRGSIIQMIGVGPEKAIKLYTYSKISNLNPDNFYYHLLGGLVAGFCQVLITSPYEMIKINLQMGNNYVLKDFYKGSTACFLRDIPFSGIYFPSYWYLKEKEKMNIFLAGTLAGIPSAFLCTPMDVVKTRMQTLSNNNNGFKQTVKDVYKKEGFSAFWKGGGWRVMRSSPQFGITLLVYEKLLN